MGEARSGQTRDRFDGFNGDLAGNTCGVFSIPTWIILGGKKKNIIVGSPLSEGGVIHGYPIPMTDPAGAGICANMTGVYSW